MAFDEAHYRKRRMAGLRGQEDPIPHGKKARGIGQVDQFGKFKQADVGHKPVSKKALRKNTKRARKANNNVTE